MFFCYYEYILFLNYIILIFMSLSISKTHKNENLCFAQNKEAVLVCFT